MSGDGGTCSALLPCGHVTAALQHCAWHVLATQHLLTGVRQIFTVFFLTTYDTAIRNFSYIKKCRFLLLNNVCIYIYLYILSNIIGLLKAQFKNK